jgi:hypothetical protein
MVSCGTMVSCSLNALMSGLNIKKAMGGRVDSTENQ